MPGCNNIQIVFAPLPEERDVERSAAKEFALRAAERFRDESSGDGSSTVAIHHLAEWKKDELSSVPVAPEKDNNNVKNSTVVFLISCGPDGSVHRSVRKTTKWIKEQEARTKLENSENVSSASTTAVVALLGHAVCKTSAEQMEDEVYSSGRRLAKSLQRIVSPPQTSSLAPLFLLETQIELEPPEEKFDGWVTSCVDAIWQ